MPSSRILTPTDPDYPAALRALSPPPPLHVRGTLPDAPAVALVGTRQPSPEGARFARSLAAELARAGVVVWSGGALGIDDQAHHGALDAAGVTVLVAGGGLDRVYPASAHRLWTRVVARGALLSLVADAHPPAPWTLLRRNGALAALTAATVLVEAPLQSGARSTTAAARRLGRPVWIGGQTPWSPFAPTVREELRLGARLLLHVDDLLASLSLPPGAALAARGAAPGVAPPAPQLALGLGGDPDGGRTERPSRLPAHSLAGEAGALALRDRLLERVGAGVGHLDELCEALQMPAHLVLAETTWLLLEGALHEPQPGIFSTHPTGDNH